MIYPNSNLPTVSQSWGRAIQKGIETLEKTVISNDVNNKARDSQLQNAYVQVNKSVQDIKFALSQVGIAIGGVNEIKTNIYVPGTTQINGTTIKTGTLSADKITTGTLDASSVSVVNLNATNITSGTLTGVTVQTGSTGQRVVLGGSQLNFYDGSSTLSGTMSATSTAVTLINGSNGFNINQVGAHLTGGSTGVYCGDYGSGTSVLKLVAPSTEATGTFYSSGVLSTGGYFSCPDTRTRSATGGLAVFVASNGTYHVGSSSRRFKQDILDYTVDYNAFMAMRPVTFKYKSEVEELGESAGTTVGFIAEELEDLGLTEYVILDDNGDPFGINYSNMVVGLQGVIAKQDEMIKALAARIEALESKV